MLRSEAMAVAEQLQPEGFKFNSLELHEESGMWIATFINLDVEPCQVVIERWHDVYTDADPDPEEEAEREGTEEIAEQNGTMLEREHSE